MEFQMHKTIRKKTEYLNTCLLRNQRDNFASAVTQQDDSEEDNTTLHYKKHYIESTQEKYNWSFQLNN